MPRALTITQVPGKPGQVYYPLHLATLPDTPPSPTQLKITILAAALNHRDLFIRQHLYPGTTFNVPLLADGCGIVTATGSDPTAKKWLGKRVLINPGTGWEADVRGPEEGSRYAILGGTKSCAVGTASESVVVEAKEVELAPGHLSAVEAAAVPAAVTKSGAAEKGKNVLVTGVGGGVAVWAVVILVARGANVWVTSGSEEKINRAVELGAKGGVSYKEKDWEKKLKGLLPKERPVLDAIVDGAGGDVVEKGVKLLRDGGVISQYGMTVSPKMTWTMSAVLKNVDLRGSTMGSRKEFEQMVKFVDEKKLRPLVSRTVKGLDNIDGINSLFEDMKNGTQLGKLVIEITDENKAKL